MDNQGKICSAPDCDRPAKVKGMCSMHYQRQRKTTGPPCPVPGCTGRVFAKGLCVGHYMRQRGNGTPDHDRPINSHIQPLGAEVTHDGRVLAKTAEGWQRRALVVWTKAHGRPPTPGYVIHHLNEDSRDDRPANLVAITPSYHAQIHAAAFVANNRRTRLARPTCRNGHPWTEENTAYTKEGWRVCRACRRRG